MSGSSNGSDRYVALCGGIGGAKLAYGLSHSLSPGQLTIIVNTGDDFQHLGLHVSPDIDTVLYTLSGRSDTERGWGREGESWAFMKAIEELGGPTWFNLGDLDLATHVTRTQMLGEGATLTETTAFIAKAFGLTQAILPVANEPVLTTLETDIGELPMQRYFVEHRCEPVVRSVRYAGAERARPTAEVAAALSDSRLRAILICPSNPYLSIGPMLAVPGFTDLVRNTGAPCVAVSPLVGGKAVKGPLEKMSREMGVTPGSRAIIEYYGDLLQCLVVDTGDRPSNATNTEIRERAIVMRSHGDKIALAKALIAEIVPELT